MKTRVQQLQQIGQMLNNYKYPHYYPQPELLKDQYRYATDKFEMDLPLPGYSVKVPYQEKPTRFLTVNRRKREIDYLRDHIQAKCDMEELHYQAKIEQMRRENQYNRQRLERLLNEQPNNIFQVPDKYIEEARSVSSNLEKMSMRRLQNQKQRLMMDSIDKVKMAQGKKHSQSYQQSHLSDDSEDDQQKLKLQKQQRQKQLDYIYKKKGAVNTEDHFGTMPIIKKEEQKKKQKEKEKRQEYEWIQKVRKAKATKFIADNDSMDSSVASQSSEEKKKKQKKKQQQQEQKKKQQALRQQQLKKDQEVTSNKNSGKSQRVRSKQPLHQKQRLKTPQKITERTPSREQDISNMSQFSRYANKNDIFNKNKPIKELANVFEQNQEAIPVTHRKGDRQNWKI